MNKYSPQYFAAGIMTGAAMMVEEGKLASLGRSKVEMTIFFTHIWVSLRAVDETITESRKRNVNR